VRLAAPGSWSRLLPCTTNAAGSALRRKIGPDAADPERATAIAGCAPGLQPRRAKLPNTSGELQSLFIREGRQAGVEKARANEEPVARTVLDDDQSTDGRQWTIVAEEPQSGQASVGERSRRRSARARRESSRRRAASSWATFARSTCSMAVNSAALARHAIGKTSPCWKRTGAPRRTGLEQMEQDGSGGSAERLTSQMLPLPLPPRQDLGIP